LPATDPGKSERVTTGLCTESSSQLTRELVERYAVEVVPLTVTVDGVDYLEGRELDADAFYARFLDDAAPVVATPEPGPGLFVEAYERLAASGATEILSVHAGSALSGTIRAAALAADSSPVPVRLVDSGAASFAVSCCLWEAAEALANGAELEEAAVVAESLLPTIGNVFVVGALDLVRARGSAATYDAHVAGDGPRGVPVLTLRDGVPQVLAEAETVDDAVQAMASAITAWGGDLRGAVGRADALTAPLSDAVIAAVVDAPPVREVIRYRIGPSVGAHTGPGTVAAFFFPGSTPRPELEPEVEAVTG
jgi:fatty acid kinase fatty acid binding subunit